jgi:hypothetical protein
MTKKAVFLIGVLSLASLAVAGAKKYDVSLDASTQAGAVKLAPGLYKLQLQGDKAIFTDSKNKSITVPVKVTTSPTKFEYTAVEASTKGGSDEIDAISLGGTTTKVEFTY